MRLVPDNLRNQYFRRLFLSYSIVVILITCVSGALIYDKAKQVADAELQRDSSERLNGLSQYIGSAYMERFKSAFIKTMLASADSTGSTHHIFYDQYDPNIYQIFRIVNHLKEMVAANPETESVSLYFANMRMIVDPYTFFKLTDAYTDHALIQNMESDPTIRNHWLVRAKSYGGDVTDTLFTYIYTFPNQPDLYMVIDLPVEGMRKLLDSQVRVPGEKLLMFDAAQRFVVGTSNVAESELTEYAKRWNGSASAPASGSFAQDDGKPTGWTYALIRPASSFASPIGPLQRQILLVFAGALLVGLIASYYLTAYTYRPLRYMLFKLKRFQADVLPFQLRNEFRFMEDMMLGAVHKVNLMKGQLNEKKLLALLNGQLDASEVPEQLPADSRFTVVNVKASGGRAKETLNAFRQMPASLSYVAAEKNTDHFTLLAISAEPDGGASAIRADLERFCAERERTAPFVAGIGSVAETIEDIAKSHEHALWALQYSFILDRASIIDYEDVKRRHELPFVHYEPFEHALRSGNGDAVEQFLDEFAAIVQQDDIALEAVELALLQPVIILSKIMVDMNAKEPLFAQPLLFRNFRQSTCRDTIDWIREQSVQAARQIEHYLQSRVQHDLIHRLKQYIDTHLHETISLDMLSDMAGLSTPYLSKQFKDILHVSFIDYLTNARMERARELLQSTELSVTAISARVGYSNLQYFSSRFKNKYGVTPSQFRSAASREYGVAAEAGE